MIIEIDLTKLLKEQFHLDKTIQENHHISYLETQNERLLALLVELGEFANTTRCFKFWSNKGRDIKERVLDEAADCLHFYLSLKISDDIHCLDDSSNNIVKVDIVGTDYDNKTLTINFNKAISFASHEKDYKKSFEAFISVIYGLGYTWEELEKAYYKKLGVNYERQNNNY